MAIVLGAAADCAWLEGGRARDESVAVSGSFPTASNAQGEASLDPVHLAHVIPDDRFAANAVDAPRVAGARLDDLLLAFAHRSSWDVGREERGSRLRNEKYLHASRGQPESQY